MELEGLILEDIYADGAIANLIVFPDFADKVDEYFIHVDSFFYRSFDELASEAFSKVATLYNNYVAKTKNKKKKEVSTEKSAP